MVKVERDKIQIKVGGGFLSIDEFLDQYTPVELERLERKDPLKRFNERVAVQKTIGDRSSISGLSPIRGGASPERASLSPAKKRSSTAGKKSASKSQVNQSQVMDSAPQPSYTRAAEMKQTLAQISDPAERQAYIMAMEAEIEGDLASV